MSVFGLSGDAQTAARQALLATDAMWQSIDQVSTDLDAEIGSLVPGKRVRIVTGPLAGVEGELVRVKNQDMLIINVETVGSSVRVEVDRDAIEPV